MVTWITWEISSTSDSSYHTFQHPFLQAAFLTYLQELARHTHGVRTTLGKQSSSSVPSGAQPLQLGTGEHHVHHLPPAPAGCCQPSPTAGASSPLSSPKSKSTVKGCKDAGAHAEDERSWQSLQGGSAALQGPAAPGHCWSPARLSPQSPALLLVEVQVWPPGLWDNVSVFSLHLSTRWGYQPEKDVACPNVSSMHIN